MKQARQTLVRWATKVLPSTKSPVSSGKLAELRPLDADQLRQVAGGVTATTDSPKGNW